MLCTQPALGRPGSAPAEGCEARSARGQARRAESGRPQGPASQRPRTGHALLLQQDAVATRATALLGAAGAAPSAAHTLPSRLLERQRVFGKITLLAQTARAE